MAKTTFGGIEKKAKAVVKEKAVERQDRERFINQLKTVPRLFKIYPQRGHTNTVLRDRIATLSSWSPTPKER